jgi:hypothetical protein
MKPELRRWINERPPAVRKVALCFPPDTCYRMGDRGHYSIYSYKEGKDDRVTLTMAHGRDSFLPGMRVFGVEPEGLELCGCGKWEWPTCGQPITGSNVRCIREISHAGGCSPVIAEPTPK